MASSSVSTLVNSPGRSARSCSRRARATAPVVLGAGNHSHHSLPRLEAVVEDLLTERPLAGKVGAGGGFVDDRDSSGAMEVALGNEPALHQPGSHGLEVVGANTTFANAIAAMKCIAAAGRNAKRCWPLWALKPA